MRRHIRCAILLPMLALSACTASGASSTAGRSSDRNTLVTADLEASQATNLYDIIRTMRPDWLTPRGGSSGDPVAVYLDHNRLGGVDVLRTMSVAGVAQIRYLDAAAAHGRFGMDHRGGAIVVMMQRR